MNASKLNPAGRGIIVVILSASWATGFAGFAQGRLKREGAVRTGNRVQEMRSAPGWTLPRVLMEIEAAMSDGATLDDKLAAIRIKSRACDLIWPYRTAAARGVLREMLGDLPQMRLSDKERAMARQVILAVLYRREPASEALEVTPPPDMLNQIAGELLDTAPQTAGALLGQTLPQNPTRDGLSVLSQLRDSNAALADGIALETVRALPSLAQRRALSAANSLGFYLFPNGVGAGYDCPPELARSFFISGLDVIRSSAANRELGTVYEAHQAMLFRTLQALVTRVAPEKEQDLVRLAEQIEINTSHGPFAAIQAAEAARAEHPEFSALRSLGKGELDQARADAKRIGDQALRDTILDLVAQKGFETATGQRDFDAAFNAAAEIRGIDSRLRVFAKLARLSELDPRGIPPACIDEIQRILLTAPGEKFGPAFLTAVVDVFAVDPDAAMPLTRSMVIRLNSYNGTNSPRDAGETGAIENGLRQMFRTAGGTNLGLALGAASLIENRYYSLAARLSACELHLK